MDDKKEFEKMYPGTFTKDERDTALRDRLQKYYTATSGCIIGKAATDHWKSLKKWCEERGYTPGEINRAKRGQRFDR